MIQDVAGFQGYIDLQIRLTPPVDYPTITLL